MTDFKKCKNNVIVAFSADFLGLRWIIEITSDTCQNRKIYDAWLYAVDYGIKESLFGLESTETNLDDFISLIKCNFEDYAATYYNRYCIT